MTDISGLAPLTRQITSRTVLRTIIDNSPISRAELARVTGLSKQAMSEIVRDLEVEGWVRETGRTQGGVGRSAVNYELDPGKAFLYGVDIGGTKVHASIADLSGTVVGEVLEATDTRGGKHLVEQLASLLEELTTKAGIEPQLLRMGAVGIPGAVDPKTRRITMMPNIAGMTDFDFEAALRERLGFPMVLENDVNVAAKGEQALGEGRDIDNFVFVALGTGIGMGIISERRLIRGARGAAGEISTLPIGGDPFNSTAFSSGVLETSVGSAAIRSRYAGSGGVDGLTVREIFERQDAVADTVIDEVARTVAIAVAAIAAVLDPERVIFGGSVGSRAELIDRVGHHLSRCMPVPPACVVSSLGNRAGILGAVAVAQEGFYESLFGLHLRGVEPIAAKALEGAE
ncbi:Sugar kinase of the NBD/HSP70 family, may contain an N-terminal HTH domain [Rhizobium sp. NFR07]|uniref:ROK family transcriptional regulator n=1 Tax=Rhizobium sp. NFR07 TaxID=1566262 RepID=UPI0008E5D7DD|nr:ROK family transcriptional regulator [Rhizobium sp. NFR07]SFA76736.1 Sugar kinase of the NBD/HSP70 family, may contain an N-terminal HTH domain [Rhizobium sp. NFR07]